VRILHGIDRKSDAKAPVPGEEKKGDSDGVFSSRNILGLTTVALSFVFVN
jgi:hypothetical protein